MAQPNPKYPDQNFPDSGRDRRSPRPITNLPVNALSGEKDPTQEIRSLIDQLQQTARDARNQVRIAETERNDMAAQADHFRQQNEELRARFIEITSIIRERDAALEEVDRMSRIVTDTQVRLTNSNREINEAQRQRDEALQQRKELMNQRNEGLAHQALLTQQRDELNRQLEIATHNAQETGRRLAEVQKQLVSIREARDAAQARSGEQSAKLAAQAEEIASLRDDLELASHAAGSGITQEQWDAAMADRDLAKAEAERLRGEIEALRAEHENAQRRSEEVVAELRQEVQNAGGLSAREEALASLTAAQQKIERLIRERDSIRQQTAESARGHETQLGALQAQLAIFEATNPEAAERTGEIRELAKRLSYSDEERRELAHRLEKQREATVDLAAQLRAAQDQIRQMSASLAEARLQKRGASKPAPAPVPQAPPAPDLFAEIPAPVFDSGEVISAMRQSCERLLHTPADVDLLRAISTQAKAYAELARVSRIVAVERLGTAFQELAIQLSEFPGSVTPEIVRTLQQTVEFLATLATLPDLRSAKDPATARAFIVDDEAECCEMVSRALETSTMQASHTADPAKALTELASQRCDLIVLDVSMPGINGFELCAQIRSLSVNSGTPVIFLTGINTAENRLHSTMSGGNEFVGKPFLFPELTLKALTLMLKAQFHIA